jgi:hypothetical protein
MVSAFSLWLPILLSAVFVFVASSVIHMVLGYHAGDVQAVPREDDLMTAMRGMNLAPGDYAMPKPNSMKELGTPEFKAKMEKGPAVVFTVRGPGANFMGTTLGVWFGYCIVVAFVAAYITGIAYGKGATYPQIFRMAASAGFACFAMALPQHSIWYGRRWKTTLVSMVDGLIFGCLIGGTFGWLWPR